MWRVVSQLATDLRVRAERQSTRRVLIRGPARWARGVRERIRTRADGRAWWKRTPTRPSLRANQRRIDTRTHADTVRRMLVRASMYVPTCKAKTIRKAPGGTMLKWL